MIEQTSADQQGSGQVVSQGAVSTERWLDESLESWKRRHDEAVAAFEGGSRDD